MSSKIEQDRIRSDKVHKDEVGQSGEPRVREATNDARQASEPHRLRYMLGFGIAGVVIAFAIIYFAFVGG